MKNKKYITFKYLKEIEESDLDISTVEKILGKNAYEDPGFESLFFFLNKDYGYERESEMISIDLLEKTIVNLKKAGANYMEIMHHGDHNGYVFYGIEVRKSTKEEVKNYSEEILKKAKIENKIAALQLEIQNLNEEWKKI